MARAIIILGMHRSGTSCLTGSLQEAGLQLGEVNQKTRCNEKGTRENVAIMELNDAVLAAVGASWDNPPQEKIIWRDDHKVWRKHLIKAAVQEPVWGFKDPRTLFTFDGWSEAMPNARLIATFRDPIAVAQSLNVRNGFPLERGLELWRAYNEKLLAICDQHDVAVVSFDWSPLRYRQGLEALCTNIGLKPPADGFTFFETRLRQNHSASPLELPPPLRSIHRRLQTAARMTMRRLRNPDGRCASTPAVVSKKKDSDPGADVKSVAARIAALEARGMGKNTPPDTLDQYSDLLAQDDRWRDADRAYRQALDARCEAVGFRQETLVTPTTDQAAARAKLTVLCKMSARFGAQYWSENLAGLFASDERTAHGALSWPQETNFPARKFVPIKPRPAQRRHKRLSVMFPVYDIKHESWFREGLESVLSQDLDPDASEIVVIDDGSDNDTAKTVAASYGDRIRYMRNDTNLGLVGNHNRCINEAAGDFLHILHQDDRVQPGFYDALLPVLSKSPDIVAGVTNTAYINDAGAITSETPPPQECGLMRDWRVTLSLQLRIQFPSIIVRRNAYEAVGGFSPSLKFSFDWDLWNHIAASGPIWFDPRHLAHFRVHEGSATYGFGWLERVQDAMQTVAHMTRLAGDGKRRATAEMAMHKFFLRYWMLLGAASPAAITEDQQSLIDFLLSGWTTRAEAAQLQSLFSSLRQASV